VASPGKKKNVPKVPPGVNGTPRDRMSGFETLQADVTGFLFSDKGSQETNSQGKDGGTGVKAQPSVVEIVDFLCNQKTVMFR